MDKTAKISDEFASAMQQLSAQAEQATHLEDLRLERQSICADVRQLSQRTQNLETSLGASDGENASKQPSRVIKAVFLLT